MHNDTPSKPTQPHDAGANEPAKGVPRRITSNDLLHGGRELLIEHDGRLYQLRVTQNGKLILTA